MAPWLVALIVSAVLNVAAIIIMPKPKAPKPAAAEQAKAPTASAGKPIPVVFGTMTVTETNVLWYGQSSVREFEIKV